MDGAARTFAWDFLDAFFSDMASQNEPKDVDYLEKARRFPTAGALFNEVRINDRLRAQYLLMVTVETATR